MLKKHKLNITKKDIMDTLHINSDMLVAMVYDLIHIRYIYNPTFFSNLSDDEKKQVIDIAWEKIKNELEKDS